ncbi:MAG TPA: chalcone isomerase family protein [Terriglobales bacterium]|nr:chalcone isomerase family protein [Terriglobales bacterium]
MTRKLAVVALLVTFALALNLRAAELAGVTMPDSVQVGNTSLVLNGMGVRTKIVVKVYVAGLYLPRKSDDGEGIAKADAPKRLVMQFVRDVSKKQVTDAFAESFNDNAPEAKKTVGVDLEHFLAALEDLKDGDRMIFTYIPDEGTTFEINSKEKLRIPGLGFSQALFSVWLGRKPPTSGLKKGLLGK